MSITKQPFVTQNRSLAIALHVAGAPITEVMNVYTPEMLKEWGFRSAAEAVKARRPGKLRFYIKPVDRIEQLIAAYDKQAAEPEDKEFEIEDGVPDDIRAMRLVCHSQRARKIIQRCLNNPVHAWELHSKGEGEDNEKRIAEALKAGNEISTTMPGFVMVNAMASEKTRKGLGL
jgi:hypothetical protein